MVNLLLSQQFIPPNYKHGYEPRIMCKKEQFLRDYYSEARKPIEWFGNIKEAIRLIFIRHIVIVKKNAEILK